MYPLYTPVIVIPSFLSPFSSVLSFSDDISHAVLEVIYISAALCQLVLSFYFLFSDASNLTFWFLILETWR